MSTLPGFPPACPIWTFCLLDDWATQASVEVHALLACVALLALSLLRAWLRRRGGRGVALALLAVVGRAMVAALSVRWLLEHDPALFFGDIHYTPALGAQRQRLYAGYLDAAIPAYILAACAFVVGVSVTATYLIRSALSASPEHMS